jgi:GTP-binding protein Era
MFYLLAAGTSGYAVRAWPRRAPLIRMEAEVPPNHRAGFVSILGVPNVGKSTLMNALVGERLSIITSKAQTTRHRIMGIVNGDDFQIVYSDTPGVLRPQYKLHEGMMNSVRGSVNDADVILLLVDPFNDADAFPDEKLLRAVQRAPAALLVLLNKVDLLGGEDGGGAARLRGVTEEALLARWQDEFPEASVLPISAKEQTGTDAVLQRVRALLPEHPPYFPKDQLTDKPSRFFAAEMLREAIFRQYRQEVPYSCEVVVDAFKEDDERIKISANLYVSHDSQKGIIIGKGGAALKAVGTDARKAMEEFFEKKVRLETRVKVSSSWRQDEQALRQFGYLD